MTDIETVAKVFLIAERMIDLTYELEPEKNILEPPKEPIKKLRNTHNSYNVHLPVLTIKGFN